MPKTGHVILLFRVNNADWGAEIVSMQRVLFDLNHGCKIHDYMTFVSLPQRFQFLSRIIQAIKFVHQHAAYNKYFDTTIIFDLFRASGYMMHRLLLAKAISRIHQLSEQDHNHHKAVTHHNLLFYNTYNSHTVSFH